MDRRKRLLGLSSGTLAKAIRRGAVGVLVGSAFMLGAPVSALADDCAALGGSPSIGLCTVSGAVSFATDVVFFLDNDLVISGGGKITTNGNDLTINANGNITLNAGAVISANNTGGCPDGKGGNITLNADADGDLMGNVLTEAGSEITANSNKCSAGEIVITGTNINIHGLVESASLGSGTGAILRPGGGPITVDAECDVEITGTVSSRGSDSGADLVHIEACTIKILGLVESTGKGHGVPNSPANHCSGVDRPDKMPNSTACVEMWAGDTLLISSVAPLGSLAPHKGQVNADTGGPGGSSGTSWIDLFAVGNIAIVGSLDAKEPFSVHANGKAATNDDGGDVTIKSRDGQVEANGRAVQADAEGSGGQGGTVVMEAATNVLLDDAFLSANGRVNGQGNMPKGGTIANRAFSGLLSWQRGDGDVRPNSTSAGVGVISLTDCNPGAISTTGTNFHGFVPVATPDMCTPEMPSFEMKYPYVLFPPCPCVQTDPPCVCADGAQRIGNILTLLADKDCSGGGFLGDPLMVGDELTLVGFSATCEPNPTCRATVNPATRTNTSIQVTVPACAVPGNFMIVGVTASFPHPNYFSFSCLKEKLEP